MQPSSDPAVEAWEASRHAPGLEPAEWRIDPFGALMRWVDLGNHASDFGWELEPDASLPRALYWRNNTPKGQRAIVVFRFYPPLGINTGNLAW